MCKRVAESFARLLLSDDIPYQAASEPKSLLGYGLLIEYRSVPLPTRLPQL